jgi:hypothetical protein
MHRATRSKPSRSMPPCALLAIAAAACGGGPGDAGAAALTVTIAARSSPCAAEAIVFGASAAGVAFTCDLDGEVGACASPFALPPGLATGTHALRVTGAAGGATASSSILFTIDASAEVEVAGTSPPADGSSRVDGAGLISFVAGEPVTARCSLDGAGPVDCSSPRLDGAFPYAGLDERENPHRFEVVVTDACGNTASARVELEVDGTPPAPCLVEASTGACLAAPPRTGGAGALTFAGEPGAYACALTTEAPAGVAVPAEPPLGQSFECRPGEPIEFAGLLDLGGEPHAYTLVVAGVDLHGNASLTRLPWLVDTTGPAVRIEAASPRPERGELVVSYRVAGQDDVSGVTCDLDGVPCVCGPASASCGQVSAGAHRLTVVAHDAFGNRGAPGLAAPVMTYGPAGGRAILLGFDLEEANPSAVALLQAAVNTVPWKRSGAFDRPLRVLAYPGGAPSFGELVNVRGALDGLIDPDRAELLSDPSPAALARALPGMDVLLVLDLNDGRSAKEIGAAWGEDPTLREFLDAGGVVVVLDGLSGFAAGLPIASDTWQVLAGGPDPIVAVSSAFADGVAPPPLRYLPTVVETVLGRPSELFTTASPAPPNGRVHFRLGEGELARETYGVASLLSSGASVIEKIFPVYKVAIRVPVTAPGAPFTVGTTLPDGDVAGVECAIAVVRCDSPGGCCAGADPRASACACPVVDAATHTFALPEPPGSYVVEARVLSPRRQLADPAADPAPRPGRTAEQAVVITGRE